MKPWLQGTQCVGEKGQLEIGGCSTFQIAYDYGTPVHVIDEKFARQRMLEYVEAFEDSYGYSHVSFAGKSFLCSAWCYVLEQEGMGLDVCSQGELHVARKAGFPPEAITVHGCAKDREFLEAAIDYRVGRIVIDNLDEIRVISNLADQFDVKQGVLIRVVPGVDTHTQAKISTGAPNTKFGCHIVGGIATEGVREILDSPNLVFGGLHSHIGSSITDFQGFYDQIDEVLQFARAIEKDFKAEIPEVNIGGGLGIAYLPDEQVPTITEFVEAICSHFKASLEKYEVASKPQLSAEPGRSIIAPAGITLQKVCVVKKIPDGTVHVILDGGLSNNPRVVMYDAKYHMFLANRPQAQHDMRVTVSGSHCETDLIREDVLVPHDIRPGDIMVVQCTGAYGHVMSSNYNGTCRPAVILVNDGAANLIVQREEFDDLVYRDSVPARLLK